MGMFDIITDVDKYIGICPLCNKPFHKDQEWQTKSGKRILFDYTFDEFRKLYPNFELHTVCDNCNKLISFKVTQKDIKCLNTKED